MLWTAFMIGLMGSLHCVGMCGPIAMALPYQKQSKFALLASTSAYNIGRVITYSLLGLIIGLLGKGVFIAGLQQALSIGAGIVLLIIAIFAIEVESKLLSLKFVHRIYGKLQKLLRRYLAKSGYQALFVTGLLNGLLPCGLVYFALIGALTSGTSIMDSVLFMALFGFGTFPFMMAAALAGNFISIKLRNRIKKLYPILLVLFAVLLIVRGLNFHVSREFNFWEERQEIPECH